MYYYDLMKRFNAATIEELDERLGPNGSYELQRWLQHDIIEARRERDAVLQARSNAEAAAAAQHPQR